ncbi:MAG: type II secretion system protein [Sulfurovum sp.]|nr:type II secretion system protein [Sulfurovum sp.]
MQYTNTRNGFSMITAISMIVLMSSVAIFIMSLSGKLIKETTTQYQREQATLLANSYTEYAIMAVTANDRSTGSCIQTINGTFGIAPNSYNARIHISYIGTELEIANCAGTRQLATLTAGSSTPLNIIVDAYIDYQDLDMPNGNNLTYHRRTIQKI